MNSRSQIVKVMPNPSPIHIHTITEYHRRAGLPQPAHPLISVIDVGKVMPAGNATTISLIFDFYLISMKRTHHVKYKYGQHTNDHDDGILFFMAPGQLFSIELEKGKQHERSGWMILIHPDLLWNTPLAKTIRKYEFFDYSVNEALYLSDREEATLKSIAQLIEQEYESNIDQFTQNVLIAQLELLLSYSQRFYQRQFITRKAANHEILVRLEDLITSYFKSGSLVTKGLPSVAWIAESLHMSPGYLSDMLKSLTGQTTQQHLHNRLIELAKEKLSTTNLSVSEIAYELGFEHLQSFSKLFKHKTSQSPLAFRQSFN